MHERLKIAREILGYTQSGISDAVGSKLRSWQDYEAGKRTPGSQVIAGLAHLGINTNWLLTGEGPQRISDLRAETPGAFDAEQLRLALETVEEGLAATDRRLTPDKKADLVTAVYELFVSGTQVERGVILRLIKSSS